MENNQKCAIVRNANYIIGSILKMNEFVATHDGNIQNQLQVFMSIIKNDIESLEKSINASSNKC